MGAEPRHLDGGGAASAHRNPLGVELFQEALGSDDRVEQDLTNLFGASRVLQLRPHVGQQAELGFAPAQLALVDKREPRCAQRHGPERGHAQQDLAGRRLGRDSELPDVP